MPELIRSVVARMRSFVRDRRRSPRLFIRLPFSVSLVRKANGNGSRERCLRGHTRDLSLNGLALNVPQVHLDGFHLASDNRELQMNLELPSGPLFMHVVLRRYERVSEAELGCGYLLGVEIVKISDQDRERYTKFITERVNK